MVDISLLPEEKPEVKRRALALLFSQNVSLVVGSVLLLLVGGVALSLFLYRSYLSKQIAAVDQEISHLNASFDSHLLDQMIAFDDQITAVKKILDVHVDGSRIFSFLEKNTLRRVVWGGSRADSTKAEINVSGRAATYSILAQQISYLASLPSVRSVSVSGITLSSEGGVQFSLTLGINPGEFVRR